jgi:uncharacterized protein
VTIAQDAGLVLAELSSAGRPWLAIDMPGPVSPLRLDLSAGDVTVLDIADLNAVPVAVNPLEPGPGYPVQAHADRVADLFEAAFGLAEPVGVAVRAGLRRTYETCGWDTRTGAASPGAVAPPVVPAFRQLKVAVMAAAEDLGYSQGMRAAVRGLLRTRLEPLWAGPAGHFLEGGHPADVGSLLDGRVLVTNSGVADDAAVAFLTGALLIKIAEQPRRREAGPPLTIVIGSAGRLPGLLASPSAPPQAAGWFARLLADIRSRGTNTIVTRPLASDRPAPAQAPGSPPPAEAPERPAGVLPDRAERPGGLLPDWAERAGTVRPVLVGRRSAACGERCLRRACYGHEVHAAALLACDDGQAWLRLWVQTMVLAFVAGRPVPRVPGPLRSGWAGLNPRRRECTLTTVIDGALAARATALRHSYDPRCLTLVVSAIAARMLDDAVRGEVPMAAGPAAPPPGVPYRAGQVWVIPQLRWLHEIERVNPLGHDELRLDDMAPPLDFGLAGLPDWPGIRVRDRLSGLARHPLSMDIERNRELAAVALLGDDGPAGFDADLAIAGIGLSPRLRLRHAAQLMGAGGTSQRLAAGVTGQRPGWLEVVLSWPDRIIRPTPNSDMRWTMTG